MARNARPIRQIRRLHIENFQSHKNLTLDFSDGLNVIVGPSDSGKTAVIRALRWCLFNEPRGVDFIRMGESAASVEVTFDDDMMLRRERSNKVNRYVLRLPDGEEQTYDRFGNDVPPEILAAHGIRAIEVDPERSEVLNIASQLEGPFLLSAPGPTKARAIGKISGVHVLDTALRNTLRDLGNAQAAIAPQEATIAEIALTIEGLGDLEAEEKELARAEAEMQRIDELLVRREVLASLQNRLREVHRNQAEAKATIARLGQLDHAAEIAAEARAGHMRQKALERCAQRRDSIAVGRAAASETLRRTFNLAEAENALAAAKAASTRLGALHRLTRGLLDVRSGRSAVARQMARLAGMPEAEAVLSRIRDEHQRWQVLQTTASGLRGVHQGQTTTKRRLQQVAELASAEATLARARSDVERVQKLTGMRDDLAKVRARMAKGRAYITEIEQRIRDQSHSYAQTLKQLGKCPTCFSDIDAATVEAIAAGHTH